VDEDCIAKPTSTADSRAWKVVAVAVVVAVGGGGGGDYTVTNLPFTTRKKLFI
jgi:hypothetical protein